MAEVCRTSSLSRIFSTSSSSVRFISLSRVVTSTLIASIGAMIALSPATLSLRGRAAAAAIPCFINWDYFVAPSSLLAMTLNFSINSFVLGSLSPFFTEEIAVLNISTAIKSVSIAEGGRRRFFVRTSSPPKADRNDVGKEYSPQCFRCFS